MKKHILNDKSESNFFSSPLLIPDHVLLWDTGKLSSVLVHRKKILQRIIRECEKNLQNPLPFSLNQHTSHGVLQFYQHNKDGKRTYLPKTEMKKIKEAAQYDYDKKLLKKAGTELSAIDIFLKHLQTQSPESVYTKLSDIRKGLVDPHFPDPAQVIASWKAEEYAAMHSFPKNELYKTGQGVYVRSKSELIIAERLEKRHIPYRYECPLELKDGQILYPDFTILHPKTLKIYYFEHFGMFGNPEYADKAIRKINAYTMNNILLGQNLIATFESNTFPLDTKVVDSLLAELMK